ncbi:phosphotransferase [Kribbella sp. NPDC056861]|uniref:phosphotransferase n=1 Tax=Kribbella sp. NPDC056861 TaxID=3154857 RepID=UPI0034386847
MVASEFERWLVLWCQQELGATPIERLMATSQMSEVLGIRLDDGRHVVIKSRADPTRRAQTCVAVQRHAADAGFPCARPLTNVTYLDDLAVHAEQWRPDGNVLRGDTPAIAEQFARLYAQLGTIIEALPLKPPLPNPEWVNWDHTGPGSWPPNPRHDNRPRATHLPPLLVEIASRTRTRLTKPSHLPRVLGHADWETQNLRWTTAGPRAVHDWDSIAWLPEAALVGAASGAFASAETPTLAPIQSSETFLAAYQDARARTFTPEETELAWAASLWPALHNARGEFLWDSPPVALTEVLDQAEDRLHRAGA